MILSSLPGTSFSAIVLLGAPKIEASFVEQQAQVLVTPICTIPFVSIPSTSTIVTSIPLNSAKSVELKLQLSTSFL